MQLTLEIRTGPDAGKQTVVAPGRACQVGRFGPADVKVAEDTQMSNVHFALDWDGRTARVRDLQSRFGTFLNGQRVDQAEVHDGDRLKAGQTEFVVQLAPATPPAPVPVPAAPRPEAAAPTRAAQGGPAERLLQLLRAESQPLFALLDAARAPRVLEIVRAAKDECQSLYEGQQGELLARFGPYLAALPGASALLETLVHEGWGKSWGVYLTSARPFAEVRKHFRHFLLVKTPEGKDAYFRFYDPRVLRTFLPTCNAQEAREFFGPVAGYLLEADKPERLLKFTPASPGPRREVVTL